MIRKHTATGSIIRGAAMIFDFSGRFRAMRSAGGAAVLSQNPNSRDAMALRGDWDKIGGDIKTAIGKYGKEHVAHVAKS